MTWSFLIGENNRFNPLIEIMLVFVKFMLVGNLIQVAYSAFSFIQD